MIQCPTLRDLRIRHGFKLVEVAKAANMSPSRLSLFENGWLELSAASARKIAEGYGRLGVEDAERTIADIRISAPPPRDA